MVFLSLWLRSRIGASATCRCVSCLSRTAVNPAGVPIKSGGRLTILFYSSIISTAAAADSAVKVKRRDEWDAKINKLQESLHPDEVIQPLSDHDRHSLQVTSDTEPRARTELDRFTLQYASDTSPQPRWNSASFSEMDTVLSTSEGYPHAATQPMSDPDRPTRQLSPKTPRQRRERNASGTQPKEQLSAEDAQWPDVWDPFYAALKHIESPGDNQSRMLEASPTRLDPNSIYASNSRRLMKTAEEWSGKKLLTTEYALATLAANISSFMTDQDSASVTSLDSTIQNLRHNLYSVQQIQDTIWNTPRMQYPQYSIRSANPVHDEDQQALQDTLQSNFSGALDGQTSFDDLLHKVAYNLLIAPVAPSSDTYTLLIEKFGELGCYDVADYVVEAFKATKTRYTETSATAILEHYIGWDRLTEFHWEIRMHEGFNGGPMLAKPDVKIGVGAARLIERRGKVIQLLNFDMQMYTTIILGYRHFKWWEMAAKWGEAMRWSNVVPDMENATKLLKNSTAGQRKDEGWQDWLLVKHLIQSDRHALIPRNEVQSAFASALEFCRNLDLPLQYKEIYQQALGEYKFGMHEIGRSYLSEPSHKSLSPHQLTAKVRILEIRVAYIDEAIRRLQIQVLAAKIAMLDLSIKGSKHMLAAFEKRRTRDSWLWPRHRIETFPDVHITYVQSQHPHNDFRVFSFRDKEQSNEQALQRHLGVHELEELGPLDVPVEKLEKAPTKKLARKLLVMNRARRAALRRRTLKESWLKAPAWTWVKKVSRSGNIILKWQPASEHKTSVGDGPQA